MEEGGAGARGPHIGFKLPNCGGVMCEVQWATPETIMDLADRAVQLGYDSIWLHDHLVTPRELSHLPDPPFYEPLVLMTALAGSFPQITVGVATLILPLRDPVVLTKQIVTLERLHPGRTIIGLGLGQYESEFQAFGVDTYRSRGRVANEYLEVMQALLSQDRATVEGSHRSIRDAQIHPKGHFPLEPRVWIGGNSPAAFARSQRFGAGWIFSGALSVADVRERLSSADQPSAFDVVMTATIAREEPGEQSTDAGDHRIHRHASVITGDAGEVAAQMREYMEAGVTHFLLTFQSADLEALTAQMRWFSAEVAPLLSGTRSDAGAIA